MPPVSSRNPRRRRGMEALLDPSPSARSIRRVPGVALPIIFLEDLDVRRLSFTLEACGPFGPRGDHAADLRGAIGKALHGTRHYDSLFEPALPDRAPRGLAGGAGAPRPFVLTPPEPERLPAEGGRVRFDLVLLGRAAEDPAPWVRAVERAAKDGLGRPRTDFELTDRRIEPLEALTHRAARRVRGLLGPDAEAGRLRLTFRTPARILSDGRALLPSPPAVVNGLLRRLQALAWLHGRCRAELDFGGLVAEAAEVEQQADYAEHFEDQRGRRTSYRQGRRVPLDGLSGWWEGWLCRRLVAILAAGELVHVGKATTSGLGQLELSAPLAR